MADISITCPQCGKVTTVSEFIDDAHLKCQACGVQLEKPGGLAVAAKEVAATLPTQKKKVKRNLRLAKHSRSDDENSSENDSSLGDIIKPPEGFEEQDVKLHPKTKQKSGINHALLAGLLFLVLGAGAGYLRYGGILPANILDYSTKYSWIVLLAINFMLVIKAMADSMMQGILCLFIPGYSFYYLFLVTDEFYLRAIVAALLIGIGQDAAIELQAHAADIAKSINHFMASGGGDIR